MSMIIFFSESLLEFGANFSKIDIILSAGSDAHVRDPIASMNVSTEYFTEMTGVMAILATELCDGRLLSLLEGGYDLKGLSDSVAAHLGKLTEAALARA